MKMLIVLLAHVGFRFREVLQAVSDVPGYWWMQVDQPTYSRPLELLQSEGLCNSFDSDTTVGKVV